LIGNQTGRGHHAIIALPECMHHPFCCHGGRHPRQREQAGQNDYGEAGPISPRCGIWLGLSPIFLSRPLRHGNIHTKMFGYSILDAKKNKQQIWLSNHLAEAG
jgi:hypothetical protein